MQAGQPSVYYVMQDDSRTMMHPKLLTSKIESGDISGDTMIWADGMAAWSKVADIPEFKEILPESDPSMSAAAAMRSSEAQNIQKWYYLEPSTQAREGPFDASVLTSLIAHGSVTSDTLVWCAEMGDTWSPAKEIEDFEEALKGVKKRSGAKADSKKEGTWFYTDKYRKQSGPVDEKILLKLLKSKDITGDSLVWKQGMGEWKPLKDVADLASLLKVTEEGIADATSDGGAENGTVEATAANANKKKKKKKKKKWKNFENTPHVYVQGLPKDVTPVEIQDHFKKAGVIATDMDGKPRIKIYKDKDGNPKGDGLVTYLKVESVPLAIQFVDQSEIRAGCKITVQKAEFKQKGETFVPKKRKKSDLKFEKFQKQQALDWDEDGVQEVKGFRIVILKYMFKPEEAGDDREKFFGDLSVEVGSEIDQKCGEIEKLTIFENNPDGVIAVKFKSGASAHKCIQLMNRRYFGQRQIECFFFDGKTDYKVGESEESEKKRQADYEKWMMGEGEGKEAVKN